MDRRTVIAAGMTAIASVPLLAYAQSTTPVASRCVVMEEREGAFMLEGVGDRLSEPFELAPGAYRLEAELNNPDRGDISFRADFFFRENGDKDDYFSITYTEEMPDFASGMIHLRGGEYLAEVRGFGGDWKIVLTPI